MKLDYKLNYLGTDSYGIKYYKSELRIFLMAYKYKDTNMETHQLLRQIDEYEMDKRLLCQK